MSVTRRSRQTNPWESLANNAAVKAALAMLPSNYEFELPKCLWKILSINAKLVALQFPEGLLMYSCMISDIIRRVTGAKVIIMADVTYGACCIDDYSAQKLDVDLLIHYGHSCLVPIQATNVKTLYVFVEIYFPVDHLIETIQANFPKHTKLSVLGTVQFLKAIQEVKQWGNTYFDTPVEVPQVKPLSPGETLGCTSSKLSPDREVMIFLADGRFHMESAMIRNPHVQAYRYDPYSRIMSLERYQLERMKEIRQHAIERAKSGKVYGLILGTLGHQGNANILARIQQLLTKQHKTYINFLMSEISTATIQALSEVDVWVQIACPRLSIDWGMEFDKVILTPYEAMVALQEVAWQEDYPMDYYSHEKKPWSNYA